MYHNTTKRTTACIISVRSVKMSLKQRRDRLLHCEYSSNINNMDLFRLHFYSKLWNIRPKCKWTVIKFVTQVTDKIITIKELLVSVTGMNYSNIRRQDLLISLSPPTITKFKSQLSEAENHYRRLHQWWYVWLDQFVYYEDLTN